MSRWIAWLGTWLCASMVASCTDPVLDDEIAKLGDEPAQPGEGPNHRPGQPCVLCHQQGGPAKTHFAVAGTVFDVADPAVAKGVKGVQVLFVDSGGSYPRVSVFTNDVGNFYVLDSDWPTLQFPFHVKLYKAGTSRLMNSHVGREPSCSGCHRDPVKGVSNDQFGALGHIYF
ncbi:MAG TPA: hypothetical protein VNO21_11775 [Polyangiaceae bacterium]|nr:hypothetical protein [Polyangiaceae bacterium]